MPPFKECRICGTRWADRSLFLSDPDVQLAGYQVHFKELTTGLILFNHACRATLAIPASEFTDLHEGPVFTERATGSESCPGYCLRQEDLRPCPVRCECAFFRTVLQRIRQWPKKARPVESRLSGHLNRVVLE